MLILWRACGARDFVYKAGPHDAARNTARVYGPCRERPDVR